MSCYVTDLRDYCEQDIFHAECPDGEVVLMQEARFGRMGLGSCIKYDYGSMNCYRLENEINRNLISLHSTDLCILLWFDNGLWNQLYH